MHILEQLVFVLVASTPICSFALAGNPGIFGTRIRTPDDLQSYVTEAKGAYDRVLAVFATASSVTLEGVSPQELPRTQ